MAEAKYKIVFQGKVGTGWDLKTVKKNLSVLFKQDEAGLAQLFSGEPKVIKSGLSREAAARYKEKIENTGALCQVVVEEEVEADLKFKCPNCQRVLKVKAELGGKKVKCPSCDQGLVVPSSLTGPSPPPIPAPGPEPGPKSREDRPLTSPPDPADYRSETEDDLEETVYPPDDDSENLEENTRETSGNVGPPPKKPDLAGLSPLAGGVIRSKTIAKRLRLKECLRLLTELADFDEVADQLRNKANSRAYTFLILTLVAAFGTFFAAIIPFLPILTILAGVVFFILTIVNFRRKSRWSKVDLANDFRLVLFPFLYTIAEDIHPKGRLSMKLDLSGLTAKKIVKNQQIPPGRFKKVMETVYVDPWCRLEAPLAEGSRLILSIENTYISHERHWRNSRGKNKNKTKWKKQVTVKTGLAPNANVLEFDPNALEELGKKEKIKTGASKNSHLVLLTRAFKFKEVNKMPEDTVSGEELLAMYFELGKMLQAVGTGSQAL